MIGGIQRIGAATSRLVPAMVTIYVGAALWILASNAAEIPGVFALIVSDAFTGEAVAGGTMGAVIMTGIRRSAFSNEAGIGSEALAARRGQGLNEPVREGPGGHARPADRHDHRLLGDGDDHLELRLLARLGGQRRLADGSGL